MREKVALCPGAIEAQLPGLKRGIAACLSAAVVAREEVEAAALMEVACEIGGEGKRRWRLFGRKRKGEKERKKRGRKKERKERKKNKREK